jgi:integrase
VTGKRHFGTVRKRPSGKWQAVYQREGRMISVGTFSSKADALANLALVEADLRRGSWIDPRAGRIALEEYSLLWLSRRPELAVRTVELYEYLLRNQIFPCMGHVELSALSSSMIRGWHAELASRHPSTAAKAYRLLSTIMRTAVEDGLISSSPCKVKGAGIERAAARPLATVSEVEQLTAAMPAHLQLVILLAVWCQLRRGEILGLRRCDVDPLHSTIQIEQSRIIRRDGSSLIKSPKTTAGRRQLSVPAHVMKAVESHLDRFTGAEGEDLVIASAQGEPISMAVLQRAWAKARASIGREDLHLHDLRHTGLTLAAATGATTAELMRRAGHASADAALRYQHATRDRDRILAEALEAIVNPQSSVEFRYATL